MPTVIRSAFWRYLFEMGLYLSRMFDGFGRRVLFPRPKYRSLAVIPANRPLLNWFVVSVETTCRLGLDRRRPFNSEFFHSRLQCGSLESEVFGRAVLSTDFPVARFQHFFDVCSFNLLDRLAF